MPVAYATFGRLLGGLLSLAMPVLAVWQVITPPIAFVSCLYMGGMGALVALIELPMLCSCSRWCRCRGCCFVSVRVPLPRRTFAAPRPLSRQHR